MEHRGRDEPPDHAVDPIQTAIELGGVIVEPK
jgi:hypothetical protein